MSERDADDPPRWLVGLLTKTGNTPVQARWKATAWTRRWRAWEKGLEPSSRRFGNQICGACGAVQHIDDRKCSSCGAILGSRLGMALRRIGLSVPRAISVSSAIGAVLVAIHFRAMILRPGTGYLATPGDVAWALGANHDGVLDHASTEWWRWGAAVFLHFGMLHLASNVFALAQIGPLVEDAFGRGVTVFAFALTGLAASVGSSVVHELLGTRFIGVGASGAISGLIGMAAAYGHRLRTPEGKHLREFMVQWMVYTTLFGFMVNADHAAHFSGFGMGLVIGGLAPLELQRRPAVRTVLGMVGTLACVVAAMIPLSRRPPPPVPPEVLYDLPAEGADSERGE